MFLSPNFDAATGIFFRRAPTPPQEELRAELEDDEYEETRRDTMEQIAVRDHFETLRPGMPIFLVAAGAIPAARTARAPLLPCRNSTRR